MEKVSPVVLIKKVNGLPKIVVYKAFGLVIFSEFDDKGRRIEDRFLDFTLRPRRFGQHNCFGWRYNYGEKGAPVEAIPMEEP